MTLRTLIAAGAAGLLLPRMASAQDQQLTPAAVFHDPKTPVMGNPDGDITIADFFDCQYPDCKAAHPDLLDVVASDGNVRLVLKDWPILTASTFASQSGLGAVNLGAYDDVNHVLMQTTGCLNQEIVDAAVATIANPEEGMQAYRDNRSTWDALLQRNQQQAVALGFDGTPAFMIGTRHYAGGLNPRALTEAIEDAGAA